ncbi:BppU family phage baseplate upper protein [Listeria monocytogenes]|nr:BppU family phage baseplate upper protein [Listeria monocytogenes]
MSVLRKIRATLDLNKKTWNVERIEAVQGDIDSLTLAVQIVEDGKLKDLTGYKLTFAVVLPETVNYVIDDLHFDNEKLEEGYFEYTFVKEAFSVAGVYDTARFILQNEDGTELSGMPRFTYYVEKDPLQGKVVAESYVSDFERLEALIHDVELEIDSLHTEIDKESARLNTEIEKIDAKIDTETSKLQSEADDLQQQFDSINPEQFAQKTALDEHVNDADIHVTVTDKTNWNAKETVEGAQAKADKALNDAKVYTDNNLDAYGVWINVNLASGYSTGDSNTPQYRLVRKMTNEGLKTFAEFRGAVAGTFISTANSTLATMPSGTRPIVTYYGAAASNNGNGGRIAILVDGKMLQVSSTDNANPSYISLSGISYEVGN